MDRENFKAQLKRLAEITNYYADVPNGCPHYECPLCRGRTEGVAEICPECKQYLKDTEAGHTINQLEARLLGVSK